MKRRVSEEQIIGALREQEAGEKVMEINCRHGISAQAFYRWKAKCGATVACDVRRLTALEAENAKLMCLVAGSGWPILDLSGGRIKSCRAEGQGLPARIKALAAGRRWFATLRIRALLRWAGWRVSHKAAHRITVEEGLKVRRRKTKRVSGAARRPMPVPPAAKEPWSREVAHDAPATGRRSRIASILDVGTRGCPAIDARRCDDNAARPHSSLIYETPEEGKVTNPAAILRDAILGAGHA